MIYIIIVLIMLMFFDVAASLLAFEKLSKKLEDGEDEKL